MAKWRIRQDCGARRPGHRRPSRPQRRGARPPWRVPARARLVGRRASLLLALAPILIAGCTEHGAMPTRPVVGAADSEWQRFYPAITGQGLNAAWGLDADDMWAVGDRGTILRFDGQAVTAIESPTRKDLIAIDGCDRDEIWAATGQGEILRWNGRSWSRDHDLSSIISGFNWLSAICCLAPDTVFVGGLYTANNAIRPCILRFDGRGWFETSLSEEPSGGSIRKLWRPGQGYPPLAAHTNTLYRYAGESWQPCRTLDWFQDADEDLVLTLGEGLLQLRPDGSSSVRCDRSSMSDSDRIVGSRSLLASDHRASIYRFDDCLGILVNGLSFYPRDLVKPVLPGAAGLRVFAVGDDAGFMRLTWQADRTLRAEDLVRAADNRCVRELTGDGVHLYFQDQARRLYRGGLSAWRQIEIPFDSFDRMWSFPGGTLVICRTGWSTCEFAWAEEGGTWQMPPPISMDVSFYCNPKGVWIDHELRPRILIRNEHTALLELWGLDASAWTLLCVPAEAPEYSVYYVRDLVGFAADDLYLRINSNLELVPWRTVLCHFDGDSLREVLPDRQLDISAIRPGQHSRRLYLEGSAPGLGPFGGYLQADSLTIMGPRLGWSDLCEVDADLVVCLTATSLHVLGPQGWTTLPGAPADQYRQLWARRDQGLFVVTANYEVFRRDLPGGRR